MKVSRKCIGEGREDVELKIDEITLITKNK